MKFKNIITNIGSWLLLGFTLLGILLIVVGLGVRGRYRASGETNIYFVIVGAILVIPAFIYFIKLMIVQKKEINENDLRINDLIEHGDMIPINLDLAEIQSNNYRQEVEVGSGYNTRNEYVDVHHNVIHVAAPYKNEMLKFKVSIQMEPTKLKMHFAIKEITTLYVDPQNPNNHYLDLSFLEE